MLEADFSTTQMAFATSNAIGPQPGDETLFVKFESRAVENETKSREAGHPVYDDIDFIFIMPPGDRNNMRAHKANDYYKARFPKHWEAYQKRESQEAVEGMPLAEWSGVTKGQVEELKFINIRTVEQLAAVPDSNVNNMRGLVDLKQKATAFLDVAKQQADANWKADMESKLAELMEVASKQAETIKTQEAVIDTLKGSDDLKSELDEAPKKRGRPRKNPE